MSHDLHTTLRESQAGVVVPTGFGGEDLRAVAHGLRLAHAMGTSMTQLHRGNPGEMDPALGVRHVLERWGALPEGSRREDVVALGFWVRKAGVRTGDLRKAVVQFAENNALDVLVLSPGRSGFGRLAGGPTAGDAESPTLFLPRDSGNLVDPESGASRLRTILVPVAKEPSAQSAVNLGFSLAKHLKAAEGRVILLRVGDDAADATVDVPERDGWSHEWTSASGTPAAEICRVAREAGADVISMTTSGRRGFLDALRGSTVERVVADAPCPVLATPANA
jgi:nucleotide-binding universal stress UspA family protein